MATGVLRLGRVRLVTDRTTVGTDYPFQVLDPRGEAAPEGEDPLRPGEQGGLVDPTKIVDAIEAVPGALKSLCAQWIQSGARAGQEQAARDITRAMLELGGDGGATGELPVVGEFTPEEVFSFATDGCNLLCNKVGPCCDKFGSCVGEPSGGGSGSSTTVEPADGGGGEGPKKTFRKRTFSTPVKVGIGLGVGVGGALLLRAVLG